MSGNVQRWHGETKTGAGRESKWGSSNYAKVEVIVPHPSPTPSDHIITVTELPLTIRCPAAPRTECARNQIPFAFLHIQSTHIAIKWVQTPSQKHAPAVSSICHMWGHVDAVLGEDLTYGEGGGGLSYPVLIQSDSFTNIGWKNKKCFDGLFLCPSGIHRAL